MLIDAQVLGLMRHGFGFRLMHFQVGDAILQAGGDNAGHAIIESVYFF